MDHIDEDGGIEDELGLGFEHTVVAIESFGVVLGLRPEVLVPRPLARVVVRDRCADRRVRIRKSLTDSTLAQSRVFLGGCENSFPTARRVFRCDIVPNTANGRPPDRREQGRLRGKDGVNALHTHVVLTFNHAMAEIEPSRPRADEIIR